MIDEFVKNGVFSDFLDKNQIKPLVQCEAHRHRLISEIPSLKAELSPRPFCVKAAVGSRPLHTEQGKNQEKHTFIKVQ